MRSPARPLLLLLAVLMLPIVRPVAACAASEDDASSPGALRVSRPDGTVVELPLSHTKVAIEVTAFVARTTIEQVFVNRLTEPVEAVYTFPLGHTAAVDDFELTVGSRTIRGEIKRREEARAVYEHARASGFQAALLEQERPNIFTQSVANLQPGKSVTVRLRTVETLRYERGTYRLTFPLVVGPRYIPGGSVKDAARISPKVLPKGTRSGHDVEISVTIDAGVPLSSLVSASHRIVVSKPSARAALVQLAEGDTIPNKDFLLSWSVASERPAIGVLAHRDGVDGFFTLLVQPKGEIGPAEAMPKEITFVIDTSGSMSGIPLEASKALAAKALHALGPRDTFNLIRFAGDNEVYAKQSLGNESSAIESALAWLNRQSGGGGTEMLPALKTAFMQPADPNRLRIVIFLTDGYVGNEDEILAAIGSVIGDARIYTIGIGSSVNHHLLDRMAGLGRGAYIFVRPDDNADDALEAFRSWVTLPYLTDLSIDWGGLRIADVTPERLPDLGSGQTLTLVGRYTDGGTEDVVVRGKIGGRFFEQTVRVVLPGREQRHEALSSLWARSRIEALLSDPDAAAADSTKAEVTELALAYRLMSPFTSFVGVDDSRVVNPTGNPVTVRQSLPLPESVSYEGVFGRAPMKDEERGAVVGGVMGGVAGGVPGGMPAASIVAFDQVARRAAVAGSVYQERVGLSPPIQDPDGDGNPNVNGARERDFKSKVASMFVLAMSPPMQLRKSDGPPAAGDGLLDTAFRVLADLAHDGRLSRAEGKPGLAALVAAQRESGAISEDVTVHAVATWALAEAAALNPKDTKLADARAKAASYLRARVKSGVDGEATRWARLVLGPKPAEAQLRAALAALRNRSAPSATSGQSAFDRLVRTIGRGHLKTV